MNKSSESNLGLGGLGNAAEKIRGLKRDSSRKEEIDGKQLISVPLNLIDFDEEQYREDKADYDLDGLADNIFEIGLEQPPSFELKDDGRYKVVIGEMRTRAFMLNHERHPKDERFEEIPALQRKVKPLPGMSKRNTLDFLQLSENLKRDQGNIFQIADRLVRLEKEVGLEAVKRFLAENDHPNNKVALSRWRGLAKVRPDVRVDVRASKITDKETITTLGRIHQKSKTAYRNIIDEYQNNELKESLANTVKQTWAELKAPRKAAKKPAIKKTGSSSMPAEDLKKPAEDGQMSSEGLHFEAQEVRIKDNVLSIATDNGTEFSVIIPKHIAITIERAGG